MIKSVLVTGGAGFIGSHLSERLVNDGYSVRVVDNFSSGYRENLSPITNKIEIQQGDLADVSVAEKACAGMDAVLHHAAIPSVPGSIKEPLATQRAGEIATLNLLNACVKHKLKRFVLAASSSAYGDTETLPSHEELPSRPMSPYAASKVACEGYVRAFAHSYGLDGISFRYFNIFGPRQDPKSPYSAVISIFMDKMSRGERPTIYGDGLQTRDFTYVENVVQANLLALKSTRHLKGEVCNIGCGERVSLLELLATMNQVLGTNLEAKFEPARNGDIKHSIAHIQLAKELIGYVPMVGFTEGLKKLAQSK